MEKKQDEKSISEKQITKKVGAGRLDCPLPSRKISVQAPARIRCAPSKVGAGGGRVHCPPS